MATKIKRPINRKIESHATSKQITKARTVKIVHSTYQPSKAELEAPIQLNATFGELVAAATETVTIKHIDKSKHSP